MTNTRVISWAMIAVVICALSLASRARAQTTGTITDLPTITVGVGADGKAAGYCTSAASNCGAGSGTNYGSISTTTTLDGFTFVALADLPGPPRVGDREAPESRAHAEEGRRLMESFMKDVLPHASPRKRAFAADLMGLVMSATGKAISSQNRSRSEVDGLAGAVAEMFCAYLKTH
jgi:hypothetical protein